MKNTEDTYSLIDSGSGRKLELFGRYLVSRPCAQAVWQPKLPASDWEKADALFTREGDNKWLKKKGLPETWSIQVAGITFKILAD